MRNAANKYGANKTMFGGRIYDSAAEADRAAELVLLFKAGEIGGWSQQPRVELVAGIFYRPDFAYIERGRLIFEDVKGVATDRFRIICKLWREFGPGLLRVTKRRSRKSGFMVVKEIPGGKA